MRALQGSGWQTDPSRFEALAQATVALAAATLDSVRAGTASQRCVVVAARVCKLGPPRWCRHVCNIYQMPQSPETACDAMGDTECAD